MTIPRKRSHRSACLHVSSLGVVLEELLQPMHALPSDVRELDGTEDAQCFTRSTKRILISEHLCLVETCFNEWRLFLQRIMC